MQHDNTPDQLYGAVFNVTGHPSLSQLQLHPLRYELRITLADIETRGANAWVVLGHDQFVFFAVSIGCPCRQVASDYFYRHARMERVHQ